MKFFRICGSLSAALDNHCGTVVFTVENIHVQVDLSGSNLSSLRVNCIEKYGSKAWTFLIGCDLKPSCLSVVGCPWCLDFITLRRPQA